MKRFLKRSLQPFWRLSLPIRRPLMRRIDARVNHMIAVAVQAQVLPTLKASLDSSAFALDRLEASLGSAQHSAQALAADMDLMLSSIVREIARLQVQVETLQDLVAQATSPVHGGLTLARVDDEDGPDGPLVATDRARFG